MASVGLPGHFDFWSFLVTSAGHRTHFHPRGRCVAFGTILKPWQTWVQLRDGFEIKGAGGGVKSCNLGLVFLLLLFFFKARATRQVQCRF